jgi:hypothetical protein
MVLALKYEARNPKQYQISKIQIFKTKSWIPAGVYPAHDAGRE